MGEQQQGNLRLTEEFIRAVTRLGQNVYIRSARTGHVWLIDKPLDECSNKYCAKPINPDGRVLTKKQVLWHLENKPHNFSVICPKHPTL